MPTPLLFGLESLLKASDSVPCASPARLPRKMTFCWRPTRQVLVRAGILWFAVALFAVNFLYPARSSAQDQQDEQDAPSAARQEKARKSNETKTESHVYTNDDLRKPQILTEPDRARIEERKKSVPTPQTLEPRPSLDAGGDSPAESLGEVARRNRREKAPDAEQASPVPFPMDLLQPTFAAPAPVGPAPSAPRAPLMPIAPPTAASKPRLGRAPLKRDPFSRPALSPFLTAPNPGPAPLIMAPAEPSPVAPKRAPIVPPSAVVIPAKPSTASLPPTIPGIPRSKPSMVSPTAPPQPPDPSTSSIAPTSSRDSRITVQPGDSLWKLSRRFLGTGFRWREWLSVNQGLLDPQFIQPGTILIVPRPTSSAVTAAIGNVLVHQGDSLWKIALTHYGNGAGWQCIAGANPALGDPGQIYPGQTLVLPVRCSLPQTSK